MSDSTFDLMQLAEVYLRSELSKDARILVVSSPDRLEGQMEEEEPYDGAMVLEVLHFLEEDEKVNLLCEVSDHLKPGAPFVVSTFVGDPANTRTKKTYDLAKAYALAKGGTAADVAQKFDLTRKDLFIEPEEKIKMHLRDAGFIDVMRVAQCLAMHLWVARKQR